MFLVCVWQAYYIPSFTTIDLFSEYLDKYFRSLFFWTIPFGNKDKKNENKIISKEIVLSKLEFNFHEEDVFKFEGTGIILEFDTGKINYDIKTRRR